MVRSRLLFFLSFFLLNLALTVSAQTNVTTTGGTANQLPKFNGSSTIVDSTITESNGNVGINTTSPLDPLHVNGVVRVGDQTTSGLPSNPLGVGILIGANASTEDAGLEFFTSSYGAGYGWLINAPDRLSGNTPLTVKFRANSGTWSELVTMRGDTQNVGIGTTSPAYKLSVAGTVQSTTGGFRFPDGTTQTTAAYNTGGTITGVLPGTGMTGGGYSGTVTLSVDSSVARTGNTNYFSALQVYNGGIQSRIGSTFQNVNLGNIVDFYSNYYGQYIATVYQNGDFATSGAIYASAKPFRIDHPLDPANRYLQHTAVESPDMKTVYGGVVEIGPDGSAWVGLPEYFEALNKDFRYQLTAIGAPSPNLHVAAQIAQNRFEIAGGTPGTKVSWQVTGIRQDAYAKAYPIAVERTKEQPGTYLHPELFSQAPIKTQE